MPAKNSTAITKAPITNVDPRSGRDIINSPKRANTIKGLKNPSEVLISLSLLTQYPEIYITKASLLISEGWMFIGPILIHLKLPLTSVPTPGKKRVISKSNEPIKISQSNVRNKFEGMLNAIIVAKIPRIKKITCLEAK